MILNFMEQSISYGGFTTYSGWYPDLFYKNIFQWLEYDQDEGSDKWDAMVTDVQTDPYDAAINDPGAVLHEAVGNVNLIMIAVDNGLDRMVYAGPVLSHYEFEVSGSTRLTDADWQAQLQSAQQPPPEWTSSYLVPQ